MVTEVDDNSGTDKFSECPEPQFGTAEQRKVWCTDERGHTNPNKYGDCETVLSEGIANENVKPDEQNARSEFLEMLAKKAMTTMNVEGIDEETTRMVERVVILRVATKHINIRIRQLEMKRREMCELAGLMKLDQVRGEIERERSLERRAKKCTRHFTKKVKRVLFEEIDNMVCSGDEEISKWCQRNKVYDEITEKEIEEIWNREVPDDDEPIRLNGK